MIFQNAKSAIEGITNSTFNLRASKILTGFCVLMIPVEKGRRNRTRFDRCRIIYPEFLQVFGLGRQSKYMKSAMINRIAFNIYLEKDGKLEVGERAARFPLPRD